jgi:hypothetical protein
VFYSPRNYRIQTHPYTRRGVLSTFFLLKIKTTHIQRLFEEVVVSVVFPTHYDLLASQILLTRQCHLLNYDVIKRVTRRDGIYHRREFDGPVLEIAVVGRFNRTGDLFSYENNNKFYILTALLITRIRSLCCGALPASNLRRTALLFSFSLISELIQKVRQIIDSRRALLSIVTARNGRSCSGFGGLLIVAVLSIVLFELFQVFFAALFGFRTH